MSHHHALSKKSLDHCDNKCTCGIEMCCKYNPEKGVGCNLEVNHEGPHENTYCPNKGTWE